MNVSILFAQATAPGRHELPVVTQTRPVFTSPLFRAQRRHTRRAPPQSRTAIESPVSGARPSRVPAPGARPSRVPIPGARPSRVPVSGARPSRVPLFSRHVSPSPPFWREGQGDSARLPRKGPRAQGDSAQQRPQKGGLGVVRRISGYCVGAVPDSGRVRKKCAGFRSTASGLRRIRRYCVARARSRGKSGARTQSGGFRRGWAARAGRTRQGGSARSQRRARDSAQQRPQKRGLGARP